MAEGNGALPAEFSALEPFVAQWAVATMAARLDRRITSTTQQRLDFYAAMVPRAQQAIEYLEGFSLDELPPSANRLFQLMLSLCEVGLSEEVNGQSVEPVHAGSNRLMRVYKELDGR